jgi:hypothetical protein
VEGHQIGVTPGSQQERGDVAVPDQRLGSLEQGVELDPIEDPGDPISTTDAPDRVDGGVGHRVVEIGQAVIVGAGQVAVPAPRAGTQHRFVIQRTAERLGPG